MKYRVYEVSPTDYYEGYALVTARNAENANNIIERSKERDIYNNLNFVGFRHVTEDDIIIPLESNQFGIILDRIYYAG